MHPTQSSNSYTRLISFLAMNPPFACLDSQSSSSSSYIFRGLNLHVTVSGDVITSENTTMNLTPRESHKLQEIISKWAATNLQTFIPTIRLNFTLLPPTPFLGGYLATTSTLPYSTLLTPHLKPNKLYLFNSKYTTAIELTEAHTNITSIVHSYISKGVSNHKPRELLKALSESLTDSYSLKTYLTHILPSKL